jgi:hypothetical protein
MDSCTHPLAEINSSQVNSGVIVGFMSGNNGEIQISNPPVQVPEKAPKKSKHQKELERKIGLTAAQKWIEKAGISRLKSEGIHAYGKVGQFIEQEGEHHIARTILAKNYAEYQYQQTVCEEYLAEAKKKNDIKGIEKWMQLLITVLAQQNTTAKFLHLTRDKVGENGDDDAVRVPTMPARTEITNNTQVIVQSNGKE